MPNHPISLWPPHVLRHSFHLPSLSFRLHSTSIPPPFHLHSTSCTWSAWLIRISPQIHLWSLPQISLYTGHYIMISSCYQFSARGMPLTQLRVRHSQWLAKIIQPFFSTRLLGCEDVNRGTRVWWWSIVSQVSSSELKLIQVNSSQPSAGKTDRGS